MSAPIPIKKEENNSGGYFTSWFAKKQKQKENLEEENLEEEIFSMDDDDELPFDVTPNPPTEDDLNRTDSSEEEYFEEEACFGFPCSNNIYHGYCKKCEKDSICNLISESAQQGFEDMKSDIHKLWEKDVVKVWTAFLTVCYFNIPNEAIFLGVMYLVHNKFEEKEMTQTDPLEEDEEEEEEEKVEENKKCV